MSAIADAVCAVDALAIGAHPDDIELAMAGTLLKLVAEGYRTGLVDASRAELATRGTPEQRAAEAAEAAAQLGASFRVNLGWPDGHFTDQDAARRALVRVIRQARPTLVFTHHPAEEHPDHQCLARIVAAAVHHARLANYDAESGLPRWRTRALIHFLPPLNPAVAPTFLVDISAQFTAKYEVISAYASQLHQPGSREPQTYLSAPDFLRQRRAADIHRGSLIGVAAAEGFVTAAPLPVADPIRLFLNQ
ncbi:bacillithiol biosynthesis deacetylase BshB1 [Chloracidobacterium aggregatum]|jgi:bacillithiol biosynthesis deacetylase BshB1|uniref:bacillithiol biosynthesis deacetylase BshB1 n=1 Tax=Chloracidobacterium aggregatum TaxID=2851959 RepID=UPI001B8D0405|nr:bacillithiol biosynthesis deacetylase BshB1 [Chloracidobacterium aggregatum]QUV86352.1 bacillithiol biosynthesis deacetylase BshB1 [Chloracidobacterium sp. 2]QUV89219.1 bacillithiol biosynthesis deacetylase BshB1 [Chloracidobacterium sp. S]QUV92780.1 bacillithiol biosynthesis deacetylase BshB1 [Chloracidobacterium sp. A]